MRATGRACLWGALSLTLIAACGCAGAQKLRRQVAADQRVRYDLWLGERKGAGKERPVISGSLSLEEALFIALGNSRQIQTAVLEKEKANARMTEAYSAALPTADVAASFTRLDREPLSSVDRDTYRASLTVTQPLYRGGSVTAGVRAAYVYSMFTDERLRGAYQQTLFDARQAYYNVLLAAELERAGAEALTVAERIHKDAVAERDAGVSTDFDVLRAEVEMKNLTAQCVLLQNQHQQTFTTLYDVLGVSQESRQVVLTDPLAERPVEGDMEKAVETAFHLHPDLLQADLDIRLQQEAVVVARSGWLPSVDAFVQEAYAQPDPHDLTQNEFNDAWQAGVSLTWRIFDGFATGARVESAKATLRQSRIALADAEARVLLQIRQALLNMQSAQKLVESQRANKQQAVRALELAEIGLKEGVRKQVEVLDARRALTQADATYAQALYNSEIARLQYEQATGTLVPPKPKSAATGK